VRTIVVVAVLVASTAAPGVALQQDAKTHVWTDVSGASGNYLDAESPPPYAVKGAWFAERADDPVIIAVHMERLPGATASPLGNNPVYLQLRSGWTQRSHKDVVLGDHLVTAVQVCTNNRPEPDQRKIKGVRFWGRRATAAGTWDTAEQSGSFERPHCRFWEARRDCPNNHFATALRGYYVDRSRGYAGIALRCTKLMP
jgi:hypothetical protein